MMADLHLPIQPRSDLALLNGLIHVVIEHDLVDRDYVDAYTTGFDELRESVRDYTPERVAGDHRPRARGDLPHGLGLRQRQGRVHRLDDGREPQLQGHRDGQRHQQPGAHHRQHRPRGRGAVLDHRTVQRDGHARERLRLEPAGLPQVREREPTATSWRRCGASRPTAFRRRAAWRIPTSSRPRSTGASARCGSSPPTRSCRSRTSARCGRRWRGSSSSSCRTATSRRRPASSPTSMLPAAIWGEKEGTYTNSERRVSKVNRAVAPPGEARADFDIFLALADKLGVRDELFPGWTHARRRVRRVAARVGGPPVRLLRHHLRGISRTHGGVQWPFPGRRHEPAATRRLYAFGGFQTDDGRAELIPTEWEPFPEQPTPEYPLVLNTGRTVEHWHTRTKTGKVPILERLSPERLAGDEPARRARPAPDAAGHRGRGVAPRPHPERRAAADRNRGARPGLRAVPLRRGQREPGDAERVRSLLPGAQLQAVGGARRARRRGGGR